MPIRRHRIALPLLLAFAVAGCSHTEPPTAVPQSPEGPFGTTTPIRLTFNSGQDIYPTYSEDGQSILYTFQVPGRTDRDRCLGILPAAGGSRTFEVCETRLAYNDTTDMIASGALAADGRLIYLHTTSRTNAQVPTSSRLYLTDTTAHATPRLLLTMPMPFAGSSVDWLADIRWTGDATFLALGQQYTVIPVGAGAARDTIYIPLGVAKGTITASGATLQLVPGTEGATSYARSADGTGIIFTRGGTDIFRVPTDGGAATTIATIAIQGTGDRIAGLDCQDGRCLVLVSFNRISPPAAPGVTHVVYSMDETGGAMTSRAVTETATWFWPRLSPVSDDFVLVTSVGGRDIHLFRGLL
jgi:hypothetical protein